MKRKRFYKNVKRNQTWTEEVQGREIDFADKYANDGIYSDKFDYLRPKQKPKFKKKKLGKKFKGFLKGTAAVLISIAIIGVGYAAMDVYMIRHRMPDMNSPEASENKSDFSQVLLELHSEYIDVVSLDGEAMLEAVISEANSYSFSSVAFDIKRAQGTIGFKSALANAETYGTEAFAAAKMKPSVEALTQANILPVGIVYCYLDNTVPSADNSLALQNSDGSLYRDSKDNTYLNPNSDEAYRYIRDIISEVYNQGIRVFVLKGTDLPDDIKTGYADGFAVLAERLYSDIGTDIKLIEAVDITLSEEASDKDSNEIQEKIKNDLSDGGVYFITIPASADKYLIKEKLEESGISSFILAYEVK